MRRRARVRAAGEYEIGLRLTTDTDGLDADTAALSVVDNDPPEPAIAVDPASPRPNEVVVLSGGDSVDPDGWIVEHAWSLPDGNASGVSVETAFREPGEYAVTRRHRRRRRQYNGADKVEVAPNEPPTAALSGAPDAVETGDRLLLDAGGSTDREDAIVGYRWDLDGDGVGDARTETDRIEYEVGGPGEYEPSVTVVDDRGATATAMGPIQ